VALACEVVSEDHIARSKTARSAIADPDFHLPRENKNVLTPGCRVPIAPMVRRETAEHEVGTRLKRNVVALLGGQREIFKMGLAVVASIYPYDHPRAPSDREIIVHAKAYFASSPMANLWHPCSARFHRNVKKTQHPTFPLPTKAIVRFWRPNSTCFPNRTSPGSISWTDRASNYFWPHQNSKVSAH
jgi:hypothetical protein